MVTRILRVLSRLGRFGAVVAATVVVAVVLAATPLLPDAGLLLGALTGMAMAAFGDRSDEPGPDTFDTYPRPTPTTGTRATEPFQVGVPPFVTSLAASSSRTT